MNRCTKHETASPRLAALVSLAVAVACAAVLVLGAPGIRLLPHMRDGAAPRVTLLTLSARAEPASKSAAQALWSPALIALPVRVEESRRLSEKRLGVEAPPPLEAPKPSTGFLDRPGLVRPSDRPAVFAAMPASPSSLSGGRERAALPAAPPLPELPRVEASGGLNGRESDLADLPLDLAPRFARPARVSAVLRFDETGQARDVLVETGADDPALNAEFVRRLYRVRLLAPNGPREGRLLFDFPGVRPAGAAAKTP